MKFVIEQIGAVLRSLGFRGSGRNYRKMTDSAIMVVNCQKSSDPGRFYVNLGVQPTAIATEGNALPDPKTIKEYDCVFRRRLSPPDGLGWTREPTDSELATLLRDLRHAHDVYLVPLSEMPGFLTDLTPEGLLALDDTSLIGGRRARNALHLARLAVAHGDLLKARAFVELGIRESAPMASSLRGTLKRLLKRTEQQDGG